MEIYEKKNEESEQLLWSMNTNGKEMIFLVLRLRAPSPSAGIRRYFRFKMPISSARKNWEGGPRIGMQRAKKLENIRVRFIKSGKCFRCPSKPEQSHLRKRR